MATAVVILLTAAPAPSLGRPVRRTEGRWRHHPPVECNTMKGRWAQASAVRELIGLRDDVYRRPLATALLRLGLEEGWRCVDVGAGGGDVSVALAEMVGRDGRVYAVDSDPATRDEVAQAAAAHTHR